MNTWPCDSAGAPAGPILEWPVPISSLRLLRGKYIFVLGPRQVVEMAGGVHQQFKKQRPYAASVRGTSDFKLPSTTHWKDQYLPSSLGNTSPIVKNCRAKRVSNWGGALGTSDSKKGRHVSGHSHPPCRAPAISTCPALLLRRIKI